MPIYEYICDDCGQVFEEFEKMEQSTQSQPCPMCIGDARRSFVFSGGIKTDHPSWINDHLRSVLQKDGEKPIETRKEHDEYLKKNGIVQRC